MRLRRLKKPEYYFQPARIAKRLLRSSGGGVETVTTPWRGHLEVVKHDGIGKSIFFTGIYDLGLSEILWRLIDQGDFVVDVGANIGYTASICSTRAGLEGTVYAIEPNPVVLPRTKKNVAAFSIANTKLLEIGLSDSKGVASLVLPDQFESNEGVAYIGDGKGGRGVEIQIDILDSIIPANQVINLMKIDVEGHELKVLQGAKRLLQAKLIRHIVFEDHDPYPSNVCLNLSSYGFRIFRIERGWLKVKLVDPLQPSGLDSYEPANYLATLDPEVVDGKIKEGLGYRCLGSPF